jgi:steroid 5-alpha reductase family enzyme
MDFIFTLLGLNFLISVALFLGLWLLNLRTRDPSFIDGWWALGMVVTAINSFFFTGGGDPHRVWLTVLCAVWGLRLGGYLLWRWQKHGPDRRYSTMMGLAQKERGWGYGKASLLLVFALQMPLQFVVSLPVQLGQVAATGALGLLGDLGVLLAVIGIAFESLGDWQLTRFKADPANAGKVLDTGLWRYTRHPNYFGDACVWWGLFLIGAETSLGIWALPAPILITFLLTKWSGVPTTEGRMRRKKPEYEAYVARTSGFVPWFPKKVAAAAQT